LPKKFFPEFKKFDKKIFPDKFSSNDEKCILNFFYEILGKKFSLNFRFKKKTDEKNFIPSPEIIQ